MISESFLSLGKFWISQGFLFRARILMEFHWNSENFFSCKRSVDWPSRESYIFKMHYECIFLSWFVYSMFYEILYLQHLIFIKIFNDKKVKIYILCKKWKMFIFYVNSSVQYIFKYNFWSDFIFPVYEKHPFLNEKHRKVYIIKGELILKNSTSQNYFTLSRILKNTWKIRKFLEKCFIKFVTSWSYK